MTRLISEWIMEMEETAADWNAALKRQIGLDFIDLAATAAKRSTEELKTAALTETVAVVPITSGLGTISSFAESVAAIVRTMGFRVFVTKCTDVNGIYEAYEKGAGIVFMADDDRYIALNRKKGSIGDNNIATAAGYVEALMSMAGLPQNCNGIRDVQVAVLGYGVIGQLMAAYLTEKGALISVYDKDIKKKAAVENDGYRWIGSTEELKQYRYIADATSEGNWLSADLLHDEVCIAAPGVPLSLMEEARQKYEGRYIHDFLEIGTACMMGFAI